MGVLKDAMTAIYTAEFGVSAYSPLGLREHSQLESVFYRTLAQLDGDNTLRKSILIDWQSLGFSVQAIHSVGTVTTYAFVDSWRRGQGLYFMRGIKSKRYTDPISSRVDRTLVITPHSDSDLHTDVIGRQMFENTTLRFLGCNTVNRNISDMARDESHAVTPLVKAIRGSKGRWVEIHCFFESSSRLSSRPGAGSPQLNHILSNGTDQFLSPIYGDNSAILADQKTLHPDYHVEVYGQYADDLGATTNLNGQLINQWGACKFLHCEHGVTNAPVGTGVPLNVRLRDSQSLCEQEYSNFKFRDF